MAGMMNMLLGTITSETNPYLWDIDYLWYTPPEETLFDNDINNPTTGTTFIRSSGVNTIDTSVIDSGMTAVYLRPDGLRLYFKGTVSDRYHQYNLTSPFDITTASKTGNSASTYTTIEKGMHFKSDGTCLFVGSTTVKGINKYSLSTAWDITTLSGPSTIILTDATITQTGGVWLNDTGTKIYVGILDSATSDGVWEYALSTPWDVTSLTSQTPTYKLVFTGFTSGSYIWFNEEGTILAINSYYWYELSTPWDLSTASLINADSHSNNPFAYDQSLVYRYANGTGSDLELTVPGRMEIVSTAVDTGGLYMKPDGTAFWTQNYATSNNAQTAIITHTMSTPWDIWTADFVSQKLFTSTISGSNTTAEYGPIAKPDGTKFYYVSRAGTASFNFIELSLSTPWDVNTAVVSSNTTVIPTPATKWVYSPTFSNDGSMLFAAVPNSSNVYLFTLSTPWQANTIAYSNVYNFSEGGTSIYGIQFDGSGSRFYLYSQTTKCFHQYDLSVPYDLSTAVHVKQRFAQAGATNGHSFMFFKPGGDKMFATLSGTYLMHQFEFRPYSHANGQVINLPTY